MPFKATDVQLGLKAFPRSHSLLSLVKVLVFYLKIPLGFYKNIGKQFGKLQYMVLPLDVSVKQTKVLILQNVN